MVDIKIAIAASSIIAKEYSIFKEFPISCQVMHSFLRGILGILKSWGIVQKSSLSVCPYNNKNNNIFLLQRNYNSWKLWSFSIFGALLVYNSNLNVTCSLETALFFSFLNCHYLFPFSSYSGYLQSLYCLYSATSNFHFQQYIFLLFSVWKNSTSKSTFISYCCEHII